MVELDPNLQFLAYVRLSMARGESLRNCVKEYCIKDKGILGQQISSLLISQQQDKRTYDFVQTKSLERKLVLDTIWKGLRGQSITPHLEGLEAELEIRANQKIDAFTKTLPIKVLLIVMVFHFPALTILALLPILDQLLEAVR